MLITGGLFLQLIKTNVRPFPDKSRPYPQTNKGKEYRPNRVSKEKVGNTAYCYNRRQHH